MTSSVVAPLISPWPADAGYFRSGSTPLRLLTLTRVHAACAADGCGEAIYSDGGQWRHQRNLSYRCPSGGGWAEPFDPIAVEAELEEMADKHADEMIAECETAQGIGYDQGFDTGKAEGLDEGREQGRKEMHAEIDEALTGVLDDPNIGLLADSQREIMREALASAWNRCAP